MGSRASLSRLFTRAAAACKGAHAFRQAEVFEHQASRLLLGSTPSFVHRFHIAQVGARIGLEGLRNSCYQLTSDPWQVKHFSTFEPFTQETGRFGPELEERDFHRYADVTLGELVDKLEDVVESSEIPDADIEYSQGVLTLNLGPKGTFVLNKQTPNRQIWSSSPISGPARYDFIDGEWIYRREGNNLHTQLASELKSVLGFEVDIEPEPHMEYGPDPT